MGDTSMRSTGWMTRIEALLARALSLAGNAFSSLSSTILVLANRQDVGASVGGAGQTSDWTLTAIVQTPGAPGNFQVSGYGTISTSAPGDPVQVTLERDGGPIGPTLDIRTNVDGNFPLDIGPFIDEGPGPGPHVYRMLATNGTAGHTVQFTSGYALAQEVL
jgi:hypothetical protein